MEIVSRVMGLYAQIDRSVAEFRLKSGLRCPAGCGACCPTADVQVTVLEMLPAAHRILRSGEVLGWLARLAAAPEPGPCMLYAPLPAPETAGHCTFYSLRPALCRLFGFAAVRDRTGAKALSVCRRIKQEDPRGAVAAAALAAEAPCFTHYSSLIYALDPALGTRLMPINAALRHAIELIGLRQSFAYAETLRDNTAA